MLKSKKSTPMAAEHSLFVKAVPDVSSVPLEKPTGVQLGVGGWCYPTRMFQEVIGSMG